MHLTPSPTLLVIVGEVVRPNRKKVAHSVVKASTEAAPASVAVEEVTRLADEDEDVETGDDDDTAGACPCLLCGCACVWM